MFRRCFMYGVALACVALIGWTVGIPAASADTIVNIDFNGIGPSDPSGGTAAIVGAAGGGTTWNGLAADSSTGNNVLTVAGSNLLNSYGGATTVGFTVNNVAGDYQWDGAWGSPGTPTVRSAYGWTTFIAGPPAFSGQSGTTSSFTISGLGSATKADLYFYQGSQNYPAIDGASGGPEVIWDPIGGGDKELHYKNVAVTGGQITGTLDYSNAFAAGLTIVVPPVPEPNAMVLLAIGSISLLAYAWRKRR